jgi:hypothetical protein
LPEGSAYGSSHSLRKTSVRLSSDITMKHIEAKAMRKPMGLSRREPQGIRREIFVLGLFFVLPFIFHGLNTNIFSTPIAPGDGFVAGVPSKIASGHFQLWNKALEGGTFAIKDIGYQNSYLPGILIMKIFPNAFGYNLFLFLHYSAAGYFTYIFLRKQKFDRISAFLGGLSFMFCGFLSAHKGHHSMVSAAIWLPLILVMVNQYLEHHKKRYLVLGAIAFALCITADYTAVSMYIGMVTFPYIIYRAIHGAKLSGSGAKGAICDILVSGTLVFLGGLLLSSAYWFPIVESLKYITRQTATFEFFSSYSFPLIGLPLFVFPNFLGTSVPGLYPVAYFGPWNLTEISVYTGIMPLIVAVASILWLRKKHVDVLFWLMVSLVSLMLALGDATPFYRLMYRVPIYNMFRAPARNWFEFDFAVSILFSIGIQYIRRIEINEFSRFLLRVRRFSLGFAVAIFIVAGGVSMAAPLAEKVGDRKSVV